METSSPPSLKRRASGILLHLTSLPSGHLGRDAFAFADFLARAAQRWWQMLPLGPAGYGDSPYSALSAFAGDVRLLDPEDAHGGDDASVEAFADRTPWLEDWALYAALKAERGGAPWFAWEEPLRRRDPSALARARKTLAPEIAGARRDQARFEAQWRRFRAYCNERGIGLVGDLPIFVAHDSADVWAHRELFELDEAGDLVAVAGVPPDYFSKTGQRWGNPLYRWPALREQPEGPFKWWVDRMRAALARFDAVRLDHFIGFSRYWRIPASEPTAMNGRWMPGPGRALFDAVGTKLPLIAEDLGAVTPEVTRLRRDLGLPGIRLVQFAFGDDPQAPTFLPHAHPRRAVVYTGTHDNQTMRGWFDGEATDVEKERALAYAGVADGRDFAWDMIRVAMASHADTAIFPMQDVLSLGAEARMNTPSTTSGNWRWRMDAAAIDSGAERLERRLRDLTRTFGRTR